jgi:hypothetical protein
VLPLIEQGKVKRVFGSGRDGIFRAHEPLLPNGKADVNDTPRAPVRLSMPDINDAYPDGDATARRRIFDEHLYYNLGLLYFLQNDPAVPPHILEPARQWGFCRDEFVESNHFPPQLYIRERLERSRWFFGVEPVVLVFAAVNGAKIKGVSQDEGHSGILAGIGQPGPAEHAFGADAQVVAIGSDEFEEEVEVVVEDIGVDQFLSLAIHDADVHLAGVEVDSAIELGGGGVVFHEWIIR